MGMNTICQIEPSAPRTRATRFMERYDACRGALARGLDRADSASRSVTGQVPPTQAEQSFLQAFSHAFAVARQ